MTINLDIGNNLFGTIFPVLFLCPKVFWLKFKIFGWVNHPQYFKFSNILTTNIG